MGAGIHRRSINRIGFAMIVAIGLLCATAFKIVDETGKG
jgi:hypothetical protein